MLAPLLSFLERFNFFSQVLVLMSCLTILLPGLISSLLRRGKLVLFLRHLRTHLINLALVLPEQVPHMVFILLLLLQPSRGKRVLPLDLRL
jgi:hypothetical protein